jgi:hypothetical protein
MALLCYSSDPDVKDGHGNAVLFWERNKENDDAQPTSSLGLRKFNCMSYPKTLLLRKNKYKIGYKPWVYIHEKEPNVR